MSWEVAAKALGSGVVKALGRTVRWKTPAGVRTDVRVSWSHFDEEADAHKYIEGYVAAADVPGFQAGDLVEVEIGGAWVPYVVLGDIVRRDAYLDFRAERRDRAS